MWTRCVMGSPCCCTRRPDSTSILSMYILLIKSDDYAQHEFSESRCVPIASRCRCKADSGDEAREVLLRTKRFNV